MQRSRRLGSALRKADYRAHISGTCLPVKRFSRDLENGKGSLVATELNTTEARQGTRPRAMLVVLIVSLLLALIAGGLLALGWISLPGF
jgi:hypothetical protein